MAFLKVFTEWLLPANDRSELPEINDENEKHSGRRINGVNCMVLY